MEFTNSWNNYNLSTTTTTTINPILTQTAIITAISATSMVKYDVENEHINNQQQHQQWNTTIPFNDSAEVSIDHNGIQFNMAK